MSSRRIATTGGLGMPGRGSWVPIAVLGLTLCSGESMACEAESQAAILAVVQGEVWVDGVVAVSGAQLCPGAELVTGPESRAVVRFLPADAVFSIDQQTRLRLAPAARESVVDLLRGAINTLFRRPGELTIQTPVVNAAIKGTEYYVRVADDGATAVSVYEGRVAVNARAAAAPNGADAVLLGAGERLLARPGMALAATGLRVEAADELAWSLYYPPLPTSPGPDGGLARAAALLAVGRVDRAAPLLQSPGLAGLPDALALRAVIALTQNDRASALSLAEAAVAASPASAAGRIALSYALQARLDLPAALAQLDACVAMPACAAAGEQVLARRVELALASGDVSGALDACDGEPHGGLALACGFATLAAGRSTRAAVLLERAVADLPGHPLARLGRGLTRIRRNDIAGGRADLEIAAALDPLQSIVRSYLGKAYFDERRCRLREPAPLCALVDDSPYALALQQFDLARRLDAEDPTPDLYAAIAHQANNRPVEALRSLRSSIAKNDNRAVYRSSLLLDQDEAARSASLARVYRDLGFDQLALVEGFKSAAVDPINFAAHRFLADAYSTLPRHEIARVSELLQSQLRQPLNASPLQPRLGETNLAIVDGAGPASLSFNEFTPAFLREGVSLKVDTVNGSNHTSGQDIAVTALGPLASLSAAYFGYRSNGPRSNHDQEVDLHDLFGQVRVAPSTTLIAEYRHLESERGDIGQYFDRTFDRPGLRQADEVDLYRIGARHELGPGTDLIAHYTTRLDRFDFVDDTVVELAPGFTMDGSLDALLKQHSKVLEVQYAWKPNRWSWLKTGAGSLNIDESLRTSIAVTFPPIDINTVTPARTHHDNVYLYTGLTPMEALTITLGVSLDRYAGALARTTPVNPKLGLTWRLAPATTLRAAGFRTLNRSLLDGQSIEPTHVAGFNQFFEDSEAADVWRYGAGLDHVFSEKVFAGVEASRRDVEYPVQGFTAPDAVLQESRDEGFYRGYLYWTPRPRWALRGELEYEDWTPDLTCAAERDFDELRTLRARIGLGYYHPDGWSVSTSASHVDQDGRFVRASAQDCAAPGASAIFVEDDDRFTLIDIALSYRLPWRLGIASLVARNLLDASFAYQDIDQRSPRLVAERTVFVNVNLLAR